MRFFGKGGDAVLADGNERVEVLRALAEDVHRVGVALRLVAHFAQRVEHVAEDLLVVAQLPGQLVRHADAERGKGCTGAVRAAAGSLHAARHLGHAARDRLKARVGQLGHVLVLLQRLRCNAGVGGERQNVVRILRAVLHRVGKRLSDFADTGGNSLDAGLDGLAQKVGLQNVRKNGRAFRCLVRFLAQSLHGLLVLRELDLRLVQFRGRQVDLLLPRLRFLACLAVGVRRLLQHLLLQVELFLQ